MRPAVSTAERARNTVWASVKDVTRQIQITLAYAGPLTSGLKGARSASAVKRRTSIPVLSVRRTLRNAVSIII